ncbi:hypothetical protein BC943DRAFT_336189 [Umbelopsis sp. AD052]|nr:hypothetical protein BC943DRAFT_336189 [Umbelopsis sp. AD052]
MGEDKSKRKSLGFSFFKKKDKNKGEGPAQPDAQSPPPYVASVSNPLSVPEKHKSQTIPMVQPIAAPYIDTSTMTLEQRLLIIKKRVDEARRGMAIYGGIRSSTEFQMTITIDGKSPKTDPALRRYSDELPCEHPSFKLLEASDIMKANPLLEQIQDYSELDPEVIPSYQGQVPGTLSLAAFNNEIYWIIKSANVEFRVTFWLSPDIPPFQTADLVQLLSVRRLVGLPETPKEQYDSLLQLVGPGCFALAGEADVYEPETQCRALINLLNNNDWWTNYSTASSVSRIMSQTMDDSAKFLYILLLATELRLRLPLIKDNSFQSALREKIKADLIIAKRWWDGMDLAANPAAPGDYSWHSLIYGQQTAGLIRFAELMNWPYLNSVRSKIEACYSELRSGATLDCHVWDWMFGLCLPGKYYSFKVMSALIKFSPETKPLGTAPYYDSGLVLKGKTYWRITSILGRVLGATPGVRASLDWIGPCAVVAKGLPIVPAWVKVTARDIPHTDITSFDADLDDADNIIPAIGDHSTAEEIDRVLQNYENPSNWVTPLPPNPIKRPNEKDKYEIVGIKLLKNPVSIEVRYEDPSEATYTASLLMKINGAAVTYDLHAYSLFLCSHPCTGTHAVHKDKLPNVRRNIVTPNELKGLNVWDGILIVNVQGSGNAEVAARAWCAERGCHALVKQQKTCFYCAWEQARQIHLRVVLYR